MDILTPDERSTRMALIRAKNSKPEMLVRRLLHSLGYRYRLHDKRLPGAPDIVFKSRRKVIFVHGCYWHRHNDPNCRFGLRMPKTRREYWEPKFAQNVERDLRNQSVLDDLGWCYLIVWECETGNNELAEKLQDFLDI